MNQNLHQFILSARNSNKRIGSVVAWVTEPKFDGLYVRYLRFEDGNLKMCEDVLDIANVTVEVIHQRRGIFTNLIHRIRETYPDIGIYVENARPDTLEPLLKRLGFKIVRYDEVLGQHSWFLAPMQERFEP